jgi:hypothetical protein
VDDFICDSKSLKLIKNYLKMTTQNAFCDECRVNGDVLEN